METEIQNQEHELLEELEDDCLEESHELEGKYLAFELGGESFCIDILKVREIMGIKEITNVPNANGIVRGVMNLRGRVIPVVELRSRFEMEQITDTNETCIIVVAIQHEDKEIHIGAIVDSVSEIINVSENNLGPAPTYDTGVSHNFIKGTVIIEKSVKTILDPQTVCVSDFMLNKHIQWIADNQAN